MTVDLLAEDESELELARLGIRWRGHTEAISTVGDMVPDQFPVCLRVINGIQGAEWPDDIVDRYLADDPRVSTRGILEALRAERAEPWIGALSEARLRRLLDVLPPRSDRSVHAHWWVGCGAPGVPVPLDRVIRAGRADVVELGSAGPLWTPPTTVWDVGGAWAFVTYTDALSTYVGLVEDDPGLLGRLALPGVCRAERTDPVDDWLRQLDGER